jgi:hypothetical protein
LRPRKQLESESYLVKNEQCDNASETQAGKAVVSTESTGNRRAGSGRGRNPKSRKGLKNLKPFPKGVSGNPGGKPGTDLAAVYARRFFEEHPEGISPDMTSDLKGFNAYGYGLLADRGYGKVKDHVEHTGENGLPLAITIKMVKVDSDNGS